MSEQPVSLSSFKMGLSGGPGNTARKYVVLRGDTRGLSGSGAWGKWPWQEDDGTALLQPQHVGKNAADLGSPSVPPGPEI